MSSKLPSSEEDLRAAVDEASCWIDVLRFLGYGIKGHNYRTVQGWVKRWNISTEHFDPHAGAKRAAAVHRVSLAEVLVEHSPHTRGNLKRRLLVAGLKQPVCELCGQGEFWLGDRMSMVLDHINGVSDDNRLENLRMLCPNCNATLATHCGRNTPRERPCVACGQLFVPSSNINRYCSSECWGTIAARRYQGVPRPQTRKVARPPRGQLLRDLSEMSMVKVGAKYGVSDNAVRKWLRWYENEATRESVDGECADDQAAKLSSQVRARPVEEADGTQTDGRAPGRVRGSSSIRFVSGPVVVILAAGQGTRMRSKTPKLLHEVCGRPMISWVVAAAKDAGASRIVVVDAPGEPLRASLDQEILSVVQEQALGTADALRAAQQHIDPEACIVVLNGDVPLVSPKTITALAAAQQETGAASTILTASFFDPTGYGRVVRAEDGTVEKVVETKKPEDATPEELEIREINVGVYAFAGAALLPALARVGNDNAQGEYYLPDVLPLLRRQGHLVTALELDDSAETLGVNDRVQLAAVRAIAQRRINDELMRAGATIIDPDHAVIDFGVTLAPDAQINPGCSLHGSTSVGEGSVIGPHTTLTDTSVGSGSTVVQSHAVGADIGDRVSVGPFAYLRPGAILREGSKAGTFVEIKNTEVGAGSKVPHLSYIGDATIGEGTNIGASTITANYDGLNKHRTTIGSNVHTSVHTSLVAPVDLGADSTVGAGSVITKDVPEGALGIARERQRNIENYADRVRERRAAELAGDSQPEASGSERPE